MDKYSCWEIGGHVLEFLEDSHIYLADGILVPSITQILKKKFSGKYDGVSKATLNRASEKGTEVHQAIQDYCEKGQESDLIEVRNFKFLKNYYKFEVLQNEVPVILFRDDEPIGAGRLDMTIKMTLTADNGNSCKEAFGIADLKRTSTLDKNYLAGQLNLYRIAYRQTYGIEAEFLRGIHLREDTRKFVTIPINEKLAWDLVNQYFGGNDGNIQSD